MEEKIIKILPIVTPLLTGLIPAFISYKMAVKKSNIELQQVKEQSKTELEKVREQSKTELEKVREQNKIELEKIKENSKIELQKSQLELEKIKLESEKELQKLQLELELQSKLYTKNSETDIMNGFMTEFIGQIFKNPEGMKEQLKLMEEFSKLGEETSK